MRLRSKIATSCPTYSAIRRIWRFKPWIKMILYARGLIRSMVHGSVRVPSIGTPRAITSSSASVIGRRT